VREFLGGGRQLRGDQFEHGGKIQELEPGIQKMRRSGQKYPGNGHKYPDVGRKNRCFGCAIDGLKMPRNMEPV